MQGFTYIDLIILVVYLAAVLFAGLHFAKKEMKGKEYFSEIRKGGYTIVRSVCSADAHGPRGSDSC